MLRRFGAAIVNTESIERFRVYPNQDSFLWRPASGRHGVLAYVKHGRQIKEIFCAEFSSLELANAEVDKYIQIANQGNAVRRVPITEYNS